MRIGARILGIERGGRAQWGVMKGGGGGRSVCQEEDDVSESSLHSLLQPVPNYFFLVNKSQGLIQLFQIFLVGLPSGQGVQVQLAG